MLRTNSKIARFNTMQYILMHYIDDDKNAPKASTHPNSWKAVAKYIIDVFFSESKLMGFTSSTNIMDRFSAWACALPDVLDCKYHYNRSAIADVAGILQETEAEANRYTEAQAEKLLDRMILSTLAKYSVMPDMPIKVIGIKE